MSMLGKAKQNVDGSYDLRTRAGTSMAMRDHSGNVIFVACRQLLQCVDPTEEELLAIEEGLQLALQLAASYKDYIYRWNSLWKWTALR